MAYRMPRLSSSSLKHRLWRMAMMATPLPTLARPRESDHWQKHWREAISDAEFPGYARSSDLRTWFTQQLVSTLKPGSVLEFGCNVGANLRDIHTLDPAIKLFGIELNERAIDYGKKNVAPSEATFIQGSMADAQQLVAKNGVSDVDVVFTSAAAMHCDDDIFAKAKEAALALAKRAIVHLEFNAWSPAELQNMRNWRSSFLSDRWIRDYPGEYRGHPRVARIETIAVPLDVNFVDNIGRFLVSDVTGLIIIHLKN
jgi:SAM-dependent methyltransferase